MSLHDVVKDAQNVRTRTGSAVIAVAEPLPPAPPITLPPKQFRLTAVNDDTLTCVELSGSTAGTTSFTIAKPLELRIGTWATKTIDGKTYTKVDSQTLTVAKSGFTTETWKTNPTYQVAITNFLGSTIYAVKPQGGTGVSGVIWQDVNAAGRAWGRPAT